MQVYNVWADGKVNTLLVAPGSDHPENSRWMTPALDANGVKSTRPKSFSIRFERGVAEVDEALGRYLIDKGLACKKPQPEASGVHDHLVLASTLRREITGEILA